MTVHFCRHCGRLNLADFVYCPYCGQEVGLGPGLAEAIEKPFGLLESAAGAQGASAPPHVDPALKAMFRLAEELDGIERDMEEFLAQEAGRVGGA